MPCFRLKWPFSPPRMDPSDLACAEWVVLAHADWTKSAVIICECCHSGPITITSLYQVWVRMLCLASAPTTDHSPPAWDYLSWFEMLGNSWAVLAQADCTKGSVVDWECCQGFLVLITNLYQVWVRMLCHASPSTDHSPPNSWPLRFGLCRNAGEFLNGSSTRWLYQSCCYCDGLRVL